MRSKRQIVESGGICGVSGCNLCKVTLCARSGPSCYGRLEKLRSERKDVVASGNFIPSLEAAETWIGAAAEKSPYLCVVDRYGIPWVIAQIAVLSRLC